jgi:Glutamate racemase
MTRSRRVGVIGTKGTIGSAAYQVRLQALGLSVWAQACPMLVHVVEDGLAGSDEAELLAHHYLDARPDIDTLILGCTHYPILSEVLQRVVGNSVRLVESSEVTAEAVRQSVAATNGGPGECCIRHRRRARLSAHRKPDWRSGWRGDSARHRNPPRTGVTLSACAAA